MKDHSLASISSAHSHAPVPTVSQVVKSARYAQGMMPTENLRFEQKLHQVFSAQSDKETKIKEIQMYVTRLETSYAEKISALNQQVDKLKKAA